jgi:hypothetical protein
MEASLDRYPLSVILLTLCGFLLSIWMILHGLHLCLFRGYWEMGGVLGLWMRAPGTAIHPFPLTVQLNPQAVGWPLLAVGSAWLGALCAYLMRMTWASYSLIALAIASLLALGPGTILAMLALILLALPSTRHWLGAGGGSYED